MMIDMDSFEIDLDQRFNTFGRLFKKLNTIEPHKIPIRKHSSAL